MQKTYLRIEHVEGNHLFDELMKSSAMFFVFIVGVALGFIISLSLTSSFHLSGVNPNQLVGAAALADGRTESTAVSNAILEVPRTPSIVATREAVSAPAQKVVKAAAPLSSQVSASVNDLNLLIADKQTAIDRLNQELERVKDSSVALVAQFDQNCGSWSDACALPYSTQLDANNTSYADMSAKLSLAQRDLNNAQTALREVTQ